MSNIPKINRIIFDIISVDIYLEHFVSSEYCNMSTFFSFHLVMA